MDTEQDAHGASEISAESTSQGTNIVVPMLLDRIISATFLIVFVGAILCVCWLSPARISLFWRIVYTLLSLPLALIFSGLIEGLASPTVSTSETTAGAASSAPSYGAVRAGQVLASLIRLVMGWLVVPPAVCMTDKVLSRDLSWWHLPLAVAVMVILMALLFGPTAGAIAKADAKQGPQPPTAGTAPRKLRLLDWILGVVLLVFSVFIEIALWILAFVGLPLRSWAGPATWAVRYFNRRK